MLFDVAALLTVSVALSGLTGAFVVPETHSNLVPSTSAFDGVSPGGPSAHATGSLSVSTAGLMSTSVTTGTSTGVTSKGYSAGTLTGVSTGGDASGIATSGTGSPGISDELNLARQPAAAASPGSTVFRPGLGSERTVAASLLPKLTGRALLNQLVQLPTHDIARFVSGNTKSIAKLLRTPPSATSVAGWWKLIPEDARESLVAGAPELVGNLDGLPASLRDEANRAFLGESIAQLERNQATLGRVEKAETSEQLHMLAKIQESLDAPAGQPKRTLLSVDTAWPGRAAIVIGNLQTADYVSYLVPGMFFTVDEALVDWTIIAQNLHDEQDRWVNRLASTDSALTGKSVATVAWIGYQTPGIMEIASLNLAKDGARLISSAVHGVQATRSDDEPYVTLVTHSYGSTATLMALADGAITVDSLVIVGSPGSAAQSVDDLGMPGNRVFVGEAAWDPVVNTAFFGSDPGADSFGAQKMSVDGGRDPITGKRLVEAFGHLGYFDSGTEAMRNMALVGLDRGDLVTDGSQHSSGHLLASRR